MLSAWLARRRSIEEAFGLDSGGAQTEEEHAQLVDASGGLGAGELGALAGGRASGNMTLEKLQRTRASRPDIVIAAHERMARREMHVLMADADHVIEHAPRFKTLRRMAVAVAMGLDTGRLGSYDEMASYFHRLYRALEATAKDGGAHDVVWDGRCWACSTPTSNAASSGGRPPRRHLAALLVGRRATLLRTWGEMAPPVAAAGRRPQGSRTRQRDCHHLRAAALTMLQLAALQWMRQEGSAVGLQVSAPDWRLPRSAAVRAGVRRLCRENPASFAAGDKRGRCAALMRSIVERRLCAGRRGGSSGDFRKERPKEWRYTAAEDADRALPFLADRDGMPEKAAYVPIKEHMDPDPFAKFDSPAHTKLQGKAAKGFLRTRMLDWYRMERKLLCIGLAVLIDAKAGGPKLAAGCVAVGKDEKQERLIADRRPRNQVEAAMAKPLHPQARLRRLRMGPGQVIEAHLWGQRPCFYVYSVPASRSATQVLGPRIPWSWAYDLRHTECDLKETAGAWWERDEGGPDERPEGCEHHFAPFSSRPRSCGHLRRRLGALVGGRLRDRGRSHVAGAAEEGSEIHGPRWAAIRECSRCGLPQSVSKATHAPRLVEVWGAVVHAIDGIFGVAAAEPRSS